MTLENMSDTAKAAGDIISATVVLGTLTSMLPHISAALSIVWVCIRIYETPTIQRLLGRADKT